MTTTAIKTFEYLLADFQFEIDRLRKEHQKWLDEQSANLAKGGISLAYGFEWADTAIANTVKLEVVETMLAWINNGSEEITEEHAATRLKLLATECMKKALEGARSPCRSTSDMSRVVETRRTEFWAQQVSGWNSRLTKWL